MQKDLEFFRQEYKKQKKLETIVNSRVLSRPKTKKWQVTVYFVILPFLFVLAVLFGISLNLNIVLKIFIIFFFVLVLLETYLRFGLINVVKCYQRYAKEETRRRCKCIPSCSEYALICLKKIFPLTLALLKIRKRLYVTCNGEEYKIDFPTKKMGEKFENDL